MTMPTVFFVHEDLKPQVSSFLPDGAALFTDLREFDRKALKSLLGRRAAGVVLPAGFDASLPEELTTLPRIELDPAEPAGAAARIIELLIDQVQASQKDAGTSRMAASVLRSEIQTLEANFKGVEDFLYGLGNPRFLQSLVWNPAGEILSISPGETVTQMLPISDVGVSAVDLWLPEVVAAFSSRLQAVLVDASGQRHGLHANLADTGLETGWLRFTTPEPIFGVERDCQLEISWSGTQPLLLGLGNAVPDPHFGVKVNGMNAKDQTLALRAWKSLPGVKLPQCAPVTARGRLVSIGKSNFISPGALPEPSIFSVPNLANDHISTQFWENEDAIMVHPSRQGPVCAIIRDVELPALSHISALVNVGHPRSPNLNFSIGVAPSGLVDEDGYWQRRLGPWVIGVPPHGWAQAHCIPIEPIEGKADIILAASLASDRPNDMSWGLFRGFRIGRSDRQEAILQ